MLYKDILLIDDDSEDTEIFKEAVNALEKGVVFRSESNPVKALANLKVLDKLPDLIFLDYNMPLLTGKEFLQLIKSYKNLKNIPVILISSPSEDFVNELLNKNEIVNYIRKPNNYNELVLFLSNIL